MVPLPPAADGAFRWLDEGSQHWRLWTEHAYWGEQPQALSLFTGLFLHPGVPVALVGMLLLFLFGDNVEHHVGRPLFLALYVGGGVLGTLLTSWLIGMESPPPVVGSGAALGTILGAYLVFFPKNEVRVAYMTGHPALRGQPQAAGGAPYLPCWVGILASLAVHTFAGIFSMERALNSLLAGFAIGVVAALVLHLRYGDPSRKGDVEWYPNKLMLGMTPGERVAHLFREDADERAAMAYLESKDDPEASFAHEDLERVAVWLEGTGMTGAAAAVRRRMEPDAAP